MTMQLLVLVTACCVYSALGNILPEGVNNLTELSLEEFEEHFGLPNIEDDETREKHREALLNNEAVVKDANEKYENGEQTWFDEINEFSDLPDDEFAALHTGLMNTSSMTYSKGLLDIPVPHDEVSERYFDSLRYDRTTVPASYDAVSLGLVSGVKDQGNCGSCAAFASVALVETCFLKTIGKSTGDYSEQHFVDCGYDGVLNNGCNGAAPHGYPKWLKDKKPNLASESGYPYKATRSTCSTSYKTFFQGVSVSDAYWTESGTEDLLKKLVYQHGAVMVGIYANTISSYKGGVFAGCSAGVRPNHAVVVVGYGTENGVDYWLIKNSWGSSWGDKGYIKLKRGVKMCGIGNVLITVSCSKTSGTTSAPQPTTTTTAASTTTSSSSSSTCRDYFSNCSELAQLYCWEPEIKTICCKSCRGAASNTCYDKYGNCSELCSYIPDDCKKSCGKC